MSQVVHKAIELEQADQDEARILQLKLARTKAKIEQQKRRNRMLQKRKRLMIKGRVKV